MLKLKKIKLNRKNLIFSILIFLLIYHLMFSRIWFRIPVEECEEGFCETISELCIFNPFRDRTLENKIQKMIDYIKEKDPEKASRILEELKNDKQISPEVVDDLINYKKRRIDVAPYLDKIKPRDYFKKKDKIIFAFYVMYLHNSPLYGENSKYAYGVVRLDRKTKIIKMFCLIS